MHLPSGLRNFNFETDGGGAGVLPSGSNDLSFCLKRGCTTYTTLSFKCQGLFTSRTHYSDTLLVGSYDAWYFLPYDSRTHP
jgi:hypothetical protein